MRNGKRSGLTTPDLVILSLLAERGMYGYQVNLELERRCVRDWAAISRPQIYYSLEKLAAAGLIRAGDSDEPSAGLERRVFARRRPRDRCSRNARMVDFAVLRSVRAAWVNAFVLSQFSKEKPWNIDTLADLT